MRSSLRGAGAAAAATALVLVIAGSWFGYQQLAGPSCSGKIQLSVAATPEIAPAVKGAADQWVADGAAVGGTCIAVNVVSSESVDVAAAVASKHGATLAGVGQASGTVVTPDVWVPDSSSWLLRLKSGGATAFAPTNGASIARSPVVVAVPEPVATRFGWPDKKLTWTDLLRQVTSDKPLRAGIVEPTQDAAALSGLLSLTAAASATGDAPGSAKAQEARVGALRALATNRSSLRQDLLARFPRSKDPTAIAAGLGAAALSEEDVIAYNSTKPPVPLAALYLDPSPMPLDYPFAVLPGIEPAKASAAKVLFEVLTTPGFKNRLAGQSLRAPDGNWGQGFKAPQGAPSPAGNAPAAPAGEGAAGGLDPIAIQQATSFWSVATQSGRMLCVIDVSGSMKTKVATANGASREQVTVAAANQGLSLFDDSWSIGLWTFSTNLQGSQDYHQLVPIRPLSSNRRPLQQGLASIKPSSGDTGLFDTLLAAYKTVQEDWEPGKVNSIVLFTDGKNDDNNGISQKELINQLKKIRDPEQPVQVIIIGIGNDVSKAELDPITAVTGGRTFVTIDPTKIGEIFLQAIALRPPAPR
ncbi:MULTISPECIES: VWA domain-containing protein [Micromonospora]|uniref:VWA domain-containing protein n=1 Tax=Micromonospora solifontis TaxID=2487138 RepID=A0ABX9WKF5_9ACTN|nr:MULTISPECIES: substrate-binding domain-containing protein [Micromonospora]NES15567.1 VWA domain-containing protein [Micromonospora sp. PPF5-17B]NES35928.1 VWA domain-containing protein [Micromonospora solifontis]NES56898.1 VWA domain-containing protein [Micromonospora sp. PPF5-6]RNM00213.1 VWA domain-containing protein [Micromonospora solifontis]